MKLFIFFLVSLSLISASAWLECGKSKYADAGDMELPAPTIVGGIPARRSEFPWQVSLKRNGNLFCSGTIINQNWILTAAHCVFRTNPKAFTATAGEHLLREKEPLEKEYSLAKVITHPSYQKPSRYSHDFALMKVNGTMDLNENAWPACQPEKANKYEGVKSAVSGWGTIRVGGSISNELLYTTLNITTNQYCIGFYGQSMISDDMMCATDNKGSIERDSCQGDSGGPLVTKGKDGLFSLIGVVSWGKGCASRSPGVYARVSYVHDWILKTIRDN